MNISDLVFKNSIASFNKLETTLSPYILSAFLIRHLTLNLSPGYKTECKLNLVDAVIGMEGNGPTQGTPRLIGCILASSAPYPLDVVCARLIDLNIDNVYTITESIKRGKTTSFDELILNEFFKRRIKKL